MTPAATPAPTDDFTPDETAALSNLDADRTAINDEETQIQTQLDRLYGQSQQQQKAAGTAESQLEGIEGQRAQAMSENFTQAPPKPDSNLLQGVAPLLLISAFGGKAMKLNASSMLGATTGMVTGYFQGKEEQFADAQKQYQQAFEAFKQRKADMDKMYQVYQEAYKGRLDYQQKALDATLKSMDEQTNKRRMTIEDKTRLDEAWARIEEQHTARTDSNWYKDATLEIKRKKAAEDLQGMNADPEKMHSLAEQIAAYKIPMPTLSSFAMRNPKTVDWYENLTSQVQGINPDYAQMNYPVAQKARGAFTSGTQGNQVRSYNVLVQHLDKLDQLNAALKTGDWTAFNQVKNTLEGHFGDPAITNAKAASQLISEEVVKAVSGGPGALADRETAQKNVSQAGSPEQMAGVIDTWKDLAGGQLYGLKQQYEAGTMSHTFAQDLHLSPEAAGLLDRVSVKASDDKPKTPAGPAKTVVKTGTLNGRKVVQYSDGTTEYAQ